MRYLIQHTDTVYSFDVNIDREVEGFSDLPLYGKQPVAETGLQLVGNGTMTFMDDNAVVVVNISQYIISRNRFAAVGNDIVLLNGIRSQLDDFLLSISKG